MKWLGILFLAMGVGAVVLALYEWRKGVKLREDVVLPHRSDPRSDKVAQTRKAILRASDHRSDDFGSM